MHFLKQMKFLKKENKNEKLFNINVRVMLSVKFWTDK